MSDPDLTTLDLDLDAIRALWADMGPWMQADGDAAIVVPAPDPDDSLCIAECRDRRIAEAVACAPDHIAALLAEVEQLRAEAVASLGAEYARGVADERARALAIVAEQAAYARAHVSERWDIVVEALDEVAAEVGCDDYG